MRLMECLGQRSGKMERQIMGEKIKKRGKNRMGEMKLHIISDWGSYCMCTISDLPKN